MAGRNLCPSSCSLKFVCCALAWGSAKRRRPCYPCSCSGNLATGCGSTKWLERSWGGDGPFGCPLSSTVLSHEDSGLRRWQGRSLLVLRRRDFGETLDKPLESASFPGPPFPLKGLLGNRGACESLVNLHSVCLLPPCYTWRGGKG